MLSLTEQVVAAGVWNHSVLGLLLFEVCFTCSWESLQGLVFFLDANQLYFFNVYYKW